MALELPKFASETEEADWWYDHRDQVSDEMAKSVADGTAQNLHDFLRKEGLLADTQDVTLAVLPGDLELAKAEALRVGVSHEEYLASLVHEALRAKVAA